MTNLEFYQDFIFNLLDNEDAMMVDYQDSSIINFYRWLMAERPILTPKESEYLKNVIKPFRDRVKWISKQIHYDHSLFIIIRVDYTDKIVDLVKLPSFETDDHLYDGMKLDKQYTLKDLEL